MEKLSEMVTRVRSARLRPYSVGCGLVDFLTTVAGRMSRGEWTRLTDVREAAPHLWRNSIKWWLAKSWRRGWLERRKVADYPGEGMRHVLVANGARWRPEDHGRPKRDLCKWEYKLSPRGLEVLDRVLFEVESVTGRLPEYGEFILPTAYKEPQGDDGGAGDGAEAGPPVADGAGGDE